MKDTILALLAEVEAFAVRTPDELEAFRRRFTNKKAVITDLFDQFKTVPNDQKREVGQLLNQLKNLANERLEHYVLTVGTTAAATSRPHDLTLPGDPHSAGARHPLATVMRDIIHIFERIGFTIAEGPEIEDDWHNFSALNFEDNHPARDMQDTFFVENGENPWLLRTHTSSVQARIMESQQPPLRILAPGRVYRNEAVSARAHCFFHQVEGLYVAENVSFADLKQVLLYFVREMFGANTRIRLRPSYFPFTEISAEMDVSCGVCGGKGCNVCKHSGWTEILGCGMIDPAVLANCGIDPEKYSGYAFGMGVERIAQMRYGVPDLRLYSQNDLRFLRQFERV